MPNLIGQKIKDELRQLGIEPKKSLGQNFLINEGIYKKIISALKAEKDDTIIEVGPGLGTLTKFLIETGVKIIAVEKDSRLVEHLKDKFKDHENIEIIESDVLEFNPTPRIAISKPYKIVGNIPYYITSHLIRKIFEDWPKPESAVLMVQKEVAQRITAKPPEMSLLSVSVQYFSEPKIISYVSRGSFWPMPDVDSAIIKLELKKNNFELEEEINRENFFKVAKAGFKEKRKQLINNFSTGLKIDRQEVEKKLSFLGIDPRRRAETLTIKEWIGITKKFYPSQK